MSNNFSTTAASGSSGESTLSVTRTDLLRHLGRYLPWSRDPGDWDSQQEEDAADIIKSGERMFYMPEVLPGEKHAHLWSFMRPLLEIPFTAPYTTGTVSITTGTVTLAGGTWPSWAADGTLIVDDQYYEVASRTSNSVIVLEDASVTGVSGETYSLDHWRHSLPEGFSAFTDNQLAYSIEDNVWHPLRLTGVGEVLRRRQRDDLGSTGYPELAAVIPKESDHTEPTRYELLIFPRPDTTLTVAGQFLYNPHAASSGAPYFLGGMPHAETLIAATLAAAELQMNDMRGPHYDNFIRRLQASVAIDRKASAPSFLGSLNRTAWSAGGCAATRSPSYLCSYNNAYYLG